MTRPKPESELRGLVYSLTPKSDFTDGRERLAHWWLSPDEAGRRLARPRHRLEPHLPLNGAHHVPR